MSPGVVPDNKAHQSLFIFSRRHCWPSSCTGGSSGSLSCCFTTDAIRWVSAAWRGIAVSVTRPLTDQRRLRRGQAD